MDVDAKNREVIRDLSSKRQEPEDSAMDLMEGMWKFTDQDLEDEAMEMRHAENMDKRRAGQG